MKLFWIANIVFFAFLEIYSIGVMFAAKKCGERYLKCLIPFYAMYCVGHMVKNFSIMTIPVQKFHKMFLTLYLMAAGALLYACWGQNNLPAISAEALWQIMAVPFGLAVLLMYASIMISSRRIYRRFNVEQEVLFTLLSLPLITVPFLYWFVSKRQPRDREAMY